MVFRPTNSVEYRTKKINEDTTSYKRRLELIKHIQTTFPRTAYYRGDQDFTVDYMLPKVTSKLIQDADN